MLKSAYVTCIKAVRQLARTTGVLNAVERRANDNRSARWVRSLFAIYDIDDMAHLDLPWWTFDAIDEADRFLRSRRSARVFEYGSGASTIWLARRAASVTSIEHDSGWYDVVVRHLADFDNATVKLIEADPGAVAGYLSERKDWAGRSFHRYASAIDAEVGNFDLIIIDGRARAACLPHAVAKLAPDGMILFDNSGRQRYRAAIAASGLQATTFRGATACLPYPDETTLLGPAAVNSRPAPAEQA